MTHPNRQLPYHMLANSGSCIICGSAAAAATTLVRPCNLCDAAYCTECLVSWFKLMGEQKAGASMPPRCLCCRMLPLHAVSRALSEAQAESYRVSFACWLRFGVYCPCCAEFLPEWILPETGTESGGGGGGQESIFECKCCGTELCRACLRTAHAGEKCEEREGQVASTTTAVDGLDDETLYRLKCKRCPMCGVAVRRMFGCSNMHCAACSVHFCWSCLRSVTRCEGDPCKGSETDGAEDEFDDEDDEEDDEGDGIEANDEEELDGDGDVQMKDAEELVEGGETGPAGERNPGTHERSSTSGVPAPPATAHDHTTNTSQAAAEDLDAGGEARWSEGNDIFAPAIIGLGTEDEQGPEPCLPIWDCEHEFEPYSLEPSGPRTKKPVPVDRGDMDQIECHRCWKRIVLVDDTLNDAEVAWVCNECGFLVCVVCRDRQYPIVEALHGKRSCEGVCKTRQGTASRSW